MPALSELTETRVGWFWPGLKDAKPEVWLIKYLISVINDPDPKSIFGRKLLVRLARRLLSEKQLVGLMLWLGYGGAVFRLGDEILGHTFGQKKLRLRDRDQFHIFAVKVVDEKNRRQNIASHMVAVIITDITYECAMFNWVRVGGGGDPAVTAIWKRGVDGELDLPKTVRVDAPRWAKSTIGYFSLNR